MNWAGEALSGYMYVQSAVGTNNEQSQAQNPLDYASIKKFTIANNFSELSFNHLQEKHKSLPNYLLNWKSKPTRTAVQQNVPT